MNNQLTVGEFIKLGSNYLGSIDSFKLFKGVVSRLFIYENSLVPSNSPLNKLPTSQYSHVAAVYDSNKNMISTYVNGEYSICYQQYLKDYINVGTNNSNINIAYDDDGKYFDGLLDDIRIYDKDLNTSQIKAIYESYHKQIWFTDINFNYSNKVFSVVGREPINTPVNLTIESYLIAALDGVFETEEQLIDLYSTIGNTISEVNPYRKIVYITTGNNEENIVNYTYSPDNTITFSYYYNSTTTTASISGLSNTTSIKFHLITKSYDDTYLFFNKVINR